MRSERRRDLLRILRQGSASSQLEIVEALRAAGHDVTQATVSRDLKEAGAMRFRHGERFVYRLPDDGARPQGSELTARNLARTLDDFVIDIRPAHSLVVLRTAPGHAQAVARAVDLAALPDVVGTVAGDDTIFVAASDPHAAQDLAARWRPLSGSTEEVIG
ncbi:MAG: arginine repressor [Actinomycetota bacterium]